MNVDLDLDYREALKLAFPKFTDFQKVLLEALYVEHEVSAGLLAPLLGLEHHGRINLAISGLGKRLARAAGVDAPRRADGSRRWWHVIANGRRREHRFYWTLRPALREALADGGYFETQVGLYPDVMNEDAGPLFEGSRTRVTVNAYERNALARRLCIAHYGSVCFVCGFDFEAIYGPVAAGVVHVHHLQPVSTARGAEYRVDPVRDLRPVCPNCHVVIHRRSPPFTIEEARGFVLARNREGRQ